MEVEVTSMTKKKQAVIAANSWKPIDP